MRTLCQQSGYTLDTINNIWIKPGYEGITYNDGDEIENRIASIIQEASDLSVLSSELRQQCIDWPSLYHLSGTRANILRPFEVMLKGEILEIGAGCGAITRYLGECGAAVLALEGSPRRAAIARSRTRDLGNVTVLAERFDRFQCDRQFDVITLIGVLEYANLFTSGTNPPLEMLNRVRSLLKPAGKLIIAIENQLGLKYFAGAPEDHLGQPMVGIEGRYLDNQPKTYGRAVLASMLKQAGFIKAEFLAPFPDYKFPVSILTEHGINSQDFDASALAWQSVRRDPQLPAVCHFSLELAWPEVFQNELSLDLANSFLIVTSPEPKALIDLTILAYHYSTDRVAKFCKETIFKRTEANDICVYYRTLFNAKNTPNDPNAQAIKFTCHGTSKYVLGTPLSLAFVRLLTKDGWSFDQLGQLIQHYLSIIRIFANSFGKHINLTSFHEKLPGEFFDVLPHNIIIRRDNGNPELIDKEWKLVEPIEIGFLLFRSFLWLAGSITRFGRPASNEKLTYYEFFHGAFSAAGFRLEDDDYAHYISLETEIQEIVTGFSVGWLSSCWKNQPLSILNSSQPLMEHNQKVTNLTQAIAERNEQVSNFTRMLEERDNQIVTLCRQRDALETRLNDILVSKSWRLTEPFRALRRALMNILRRDLHCDFFTVIRPVWHRLPFSVSVKQKLKSALFTTLPLLFRGTQAYRNWQTFSASFVNSAGTFFPLMPRDSWLPNTRKEYVPLLKGRPIENKPVKLICFYLPQFHAIPENNAWWGKGFTEWSNVQPALPQFEGHYQPRIPDELGYYNLLDPAVQRRQIELAKLYGIEGFCFYFYWFGGKRLLEAPIENYLNDISLDLPFCLCWANENWSRRWDGLDSEVLIAQEHSPEDDIAFVQYVARYMRDRRYIRIDGKPLLLVYRPGLLPSAKETSSRWRQWCRDNDIGEIYLAYTQSFETIDPIKYGFDAAIEFPPNNSAPPNLTHSVKPLDKNFGCTVYDWRTFVERSEHYKSPGYKLFRGVCPSWDNTARRKNRSTVFLNSSPSLYQRWLENAIRYTQQSFTNPDEQLVFINAWNEWAEGAYLEPDARYGYAYLQATNNALTGSQMFPREERKVVLVTHDAYPHGAQLLALNLARTLNEEFGFHIDVVCLGDGPLKSDFARWARVHDLSGKDPRGQQAVSLAEKLYESGHRCALVNTTVSGYFLETLASNGFRCVALIHELHGVLNQMGLQGQAKTIADHASKIVFPASEVAVSFNAIAPCESAKVHIRPQGLYKRRDKSVDRFTHRKRLRQQLGLSDDAQVVLGVGYADHRKGIDLFVDAGLEMALRAPKARWVWLGHWEQGMRDRVMNKITKFPELQDRFIFPGLQTDTELFYGGADVFALPSREDPFPSVVLEALDACLPVVGFEGAGGFVGLLNEGCGRLVPKENAEAFASVVADLLEKSGERERLGLRGAELISRLFSFRHYIFDLLDFLGLGLARVSVIIPNYNYARYLPERLESIVKQNYPIYEIIFLDDCSTDKSVEVAEKLLGECGIDYKILINEENSGSVFRQWRKGVEYASGTHVWLAEADDSCSEKLIDELLKGFRTPGVVLSYCESQQIDELGTLLANNYLPYLSDIDTRQWLTPFVLDGEREIVDFLSVKNTIPNVSAVLFSRSALQSVLENGFDEISSYRIAGDWLVYVLLLASGRVAFSPIPLNKHRRHNQSVTIGSINKSHLEEIRRMQNYIAKRYGVSAAKLNQARRYIESLQEDHGITVN